jgi:hypothetical protein
VKGLTDIVEPSGEGCRSARDLIRVEHHARRGIRLIHRPLPSKPERPRRFAKELSSKRCVRAFSWRRYDGSQRLRDAPSDGDRVDAARVSRQDRTVRPRSELGRVQDQIANERFDRLCFLDRTGREVSAVSRFGGEGSAAIILTQITLTIGGGAVNELDDRA